MICCVQYGAKQLRTLLLLCSLTPCLSTIQSQIRHGQGRLAPMAIETRANVLSPLESMVVMPILDTDSAQYIDDLPGNRVGGLRFAHTFFTNISPENSGTTFSTQNGMRIWKVGIRSNGARSLNLIFNEFSIPDSAYIFIYNSDRSVVLGPFTNENQTSSGEFSIAPIDGDELFVEYHEPENANFCGRIRIGEVKHDYRGLFLRLAPKFNSSLLPCIPITSCDSSLNDLKQSVCLLIVNGDTYCVGTLVNNTAQDGKPYLLTASHCLENNWSHGNRVVAFFNYESPSCDPRIRGSEEFSLSGSVCRALSREIDFALIEFKDRLPLDFRIKLAGWTTDTNDRQNTPFTCIQHPGGEPKKYAVEADSIQLKDWNNNIGIENGNHWYVNQWEKGHTWDGSSGAPLFDKDQRLIGVLTGGGSGGINGCSAYTEGDYFSRFDKSWDYFSDSTKQLKHWLDPLSTQHSTSGRLKLDAFDPNHRTPVKRLTNILNTDTLGHQELQGGWGSPYGHNSLGTKRFAESFVQNDSSVVLGAYLVASKGKQNSNKPIYISVYNNKNGKPGDLLSRELLHPYYKEYVTGSFESKNKIFYSNKENYHRLTQPIKVGRAFYISFEIEYPIEFVSDTFQLYAAQRSTTNNTAFYQSERNWYPYSIHSTNPSSTSLWIDPVVVSDTTLAHEVRVDSIKVTRPIVFWSKTTTKIELYFPQQWVGETEVEMTDVYGTLQKRVKVFPPKSSITIPIFKPSLYILQLKNGSKTSTQKVAVGYR